MEERFRFANAAEWRLGGFRDGTTQSLEYFPIDRSPIVVLLEGRLVKGNDSH